VFGWDVKKRYSTENTYNADEIGLFYNMMPIVTLKCRGEKCIGGIRPKNHLTVLMCVNTRRTEPTPIQKSSWKIT
jgi:hypothetical protein